MGERDEHLLGRAAALDHLAVRLGQLVLAELHDHGSDDRDGDDRDARQSLLRPYPGREVVRGDLAVETERLLARADRGRVVLAGPALNGHAGSLRRRLVGAGHQDARAPTGDCG